MNTPAYLLRLQHMLVAIGDIKVLTGGRSLLEIENDHFGVLALERSFEILSEASRHLPDILKTRHAHVSWRRIADLGNVLRHVYQSIELSLLLRIAEDDLPTLERVCLAELEGTGQPPPPRA